MSNAVIVEYARTALTKSFKGGFNTTHGASLAATPVKSVVENSGVDPAEVEDVIIGCGFPEGAAGNNIGRQIALLSGLPEIVPGFTINRFCSSGVQSIALAAQRIIAGEGNTYIAGGMETISLVQPFLNKHGDEDAAVLKRFPGIYWTMLKTAEEVATVSYTHLTLPTI